VNERVMTSEDVIPTEPLNLLDDDEKSIWSGFVTRNKQFRVCMMAYTVSGDNNEFYLPDRLYNLNVSLRANFEDVQKFESQG
jgi:plasmid maintenance system killer protein